MSSREDDARGRRGGKREEEDEEEEEDDDDNNNRRGGRCFTRRAPLDMGEDDASAFEKCVDENVDRLTTLFFDRLLVRIEKLREEEEEEGEKGKDAAEELEEVAERTLMAVESRATFERASEIGFPETMRDMIATHEATLKKQLGDGGGANDNDSENYSIETQVKQRWAALTKAMEKTGNENALSQKAIDRERAKSSAMELIGRAKLNTEEAKTLFTTAVPPEKRIIEFLLEYEPGPERSQILTDALTPPDEEVEGMEENDELEVVSTTAARLSCALEVYLREVDDSSSSNKESNRSNNGDDDIVERVRALAGGSKRKIVIIKLKICIAKCVFIWFLYVFAAFPWRTTSSSSSSTTTTMRTKEQHFQHWYCYCSNSSSIHLLFLRLLSSRAPVKVCQPRLIAHSDELPPKLCFASKKPTTIGTTKVFIAIPNSLRILNPTCFS